MSNKTQKQQGSATLLKPTDKAVELRSCEGLFECLIEHEVLKSKATFEWTGPKITRAQWNEVLAFFRWTYDTEKSESQVRLFVHPEHGWLAWAFPQQGGTGMTTREISSPEAAMQRATVVPEGYVAFGTVHHHCSAPAFQSGTDTHDEESVDGLHITIGGMDKDLYSIHSRLYLKGNKFEPNLSAFWEIGQEHEEHLEWMNEMNWNIDNARDHIAKICMCEPPVQGCLFPDDWKTNYIVTRPVFTYGGGAGDWNNQRGQYSGKISGIANTGADSTSSSNGATVGNGMAAEYKAEKAARDALDFLETWSVGKCTQDELYDAILYLGEDIGDTTEKEIMIEVAENCFSNKIPFRLLSQAVLDKVGAEDKKEKKVETTPTGVQQQMEQGGWDGYGD